MSLKKKLFNIVVSALVAVVAVPASSPWGSLILFGESEIPNELMED